MRRPFRSAANGRTALRRATTIGHVSERLEARRLLAGVQAIAGDAPAAANAPTVSVQSNHVTTLRFITTVPTVRSGDVMQVQVLAEDGDGNRLAGQLVTLSLSPGSPTPGPFNPMTVVTNNFGVAEFNPFLNTPGTYVLRATAGSLTADSNTFNVTASRLDFALQPPAAVRAGDNFVVVATAVGTDGSPDPNFDGHNVRLDVNPPPGGDGLTAIFVPAADGVAVFNVVLTNAANGYSLTATALSVTGVISNAFDVTFAAVAVSAPIGPPTPGSIAAGELFNLTVDAVDADGRIAENYNGSFTLVADAPDVGDDSNIETPVKPGSAVSPGPGRTGYAGLYINNPADGYVIQAVTTVSHPATGFPMFGAGPAFNVRPITDAFDDDITVDEDSTSAAVNVLANDRTAGGSLTVTAVGAAAHGTTAFTPTGVTYTPAADYFGPDRFTYTIADGAGRTDSATVHVTVNPVNDAPVNSVPGQQFVEPGTTLTFAERTRNAITVSDIDAGDSPLIVTLEVGRGYVLSIDEASRVEIIQDSPDVLRLVGRAADVNAALDGLSLSPDSPRAGETTLAVTTGDKGSTGAGGALSDVDGISIVYNPEPPLIAVRDVTIWEGDAGATPVVFTVSYKGAPLRGQAVRVRYVTADGTATAANGDYVAASGVLEFREGEDTAEITVLVNGDRAIESDETFSLALFDPEFGLIHDGNAVATITNDDQPPHVTAVFVNGTGWGGAFRNHLVATGIGDAALGFSIPTGPAQLLDLPWAGINQVSVRFDQDVALADVNLRVRGVTVPSYRIRLLDYNAVTHTATWTLAQSVRHDKLLLDLDADGSAGVRAAGGGGARLDGEWSGVTDAFPSGDGSPGGDFLFRLDALGGDVNRDRRVDGRDLLDVRSRLRRSIARPAAGATAYTPFFDPTADGVVDARDEAAVRQNMLRTLPGGDPTPAPGSAVRAAPARRTDAVTRGLFGTAAILA